MLLRRHSDGQLDELAREQSDRPTAPCDLVACRWRVGRGRRAGHTLLAAPQSRSRRACDSGPLTRKFCEPRAHAREALVRTSRTRIREGAIRT
jgi:hypothetical protein